VQSFSSGPTSTTGLLAGRKPRWPAAARRRWSWFLLAARHGCKPR